jgi:hypothetical protein
MADVAGSRPPVSPAHIDANFTHIDTNLTYADINPAQIGIELDTVSTAIQA